MITRWDPSVVVVANRASSPVTPFPIVLSGSPHPRARVRLHRRPYSAADLARLEAQLRHGPRRRPPRVVARHLVLDDDRGLGRHRRRVPLRGIERTERRCGGRCGRCRDRLDRLHDLRRRSCGRPSSNPSTVWPDPAAVALTLLVMFGAAATLTLWFIPVGVPILAVAFRPWRRTVRCCFDGADSIDNWTLAATVAIATTASVGLGVSGLWLGADDLTAGSRPLLLSSLACGSHSSQQLPMCCPRSYLRERFWTDAPAVPCDDRAATEGRWRRLRPRARRRDDSVVGS